MKHQIIPKALTLMLTAVMTTSLLTACGDSASDSTNFSESPISSASAVVPETPSTETTAEKADNSFEHDPLLNELGTEPFVNSNVTITIGVKQNANVEDYNTNYYTTMLENVTGIDIEIIAFPSGNEGDQKLQMMVAGNETLPDIIMWGQNEAVAQQWGNEGYLLPLEDLFANSSFYAIEGYERVKKESGLDILAYQTTADGHIWAFPSYVESTTNPAYNRTWIYGPWLEKLNLELPSTTDEFKAVLEAFKTQDPNGNGKADEIPLVGSELAKADSGSAYWEFLMNAFTHSTRTKNWLVSTDGQLSVSYTQEGWKEGVKYLADLVANNLIDPVSFTQDAASWKQLLNSSGDQLVGCFTSLSPSAIQAEHPSKKGWILLEPLTGPDGYCSTAYTPDLPSNTAHITADCEHPEIAFRILDLMCREDFTITARWGKQGENWDYVKDIKDKAEYANMDFTKTWLGHPAYFYEYNSVWGKPGNTHWMNAQVAFRTSEVASGWYAATLDPEVNPANWELSQKLSAYEAAAPTEKISKITYASADLQTESDLIRDELKSYVYEKLAAWLIGTSDVEADWDAYLAELENLGLSRWLEIQQAGWNQ